MVLPADSDEINRLRVQNFALKLLTGDAVDAIITSSLASSSDVRQKRVLDVRTQTGIW
jgi:hypothetical protein